MNKPGLFLLIISISLFFGCANASVIDRTEVVNFGKVYISPDQLASNYDIIFKQTIALQKQCDYESECLRVLTKIGTDGYNQVGEYFLRKLGDTGLSIGYRLTNPGPKGFPLKAGEKPVYEIVILKTSEKLKSGSINVYEPFFTISYSNPMTTRIMNYTITVAAQINTGSCILNTRNLSFALPPISINEIDKLTLNSKVEEKRMDNTLIAKCSGIDEVGFSFNSGQVTSNPSVLDGKLSNGIDSGLGFMLFYKLSDGNEYPVKWDGSNLISIKNPLDISIPFTAYYVKTSNNLNPGNINAMGTFTISYK
ncbi:fimbrial protein [Hafnia paralvei]|uniref:fimbrial protein n=1 Tax=Hafnia paralvei TaxID=546367 RepID=UPI00187D3ED5|nr:fimbrial protein [Hafnia paralvei]